MSKTRKEIEEELNGNEIKKGIEQEKEELKSTLSAFLKDFKSTNLEVKHSYHLSDEVALKELKTALESIDIPKEIKLTRENKIVFDDKTSKWLVWWGWISYVLFFLFTVWIVMLYKNRVSESDYNTLKSEYRQNHYLLEKMKEKAPNTYKIILDELKN